MKPKEGRSRVVIEEIQPQIDGGRYPAKRVVGDTVSVSAAIFGDGHDHVAARLLYRAAGSKKWLAAPFGAPDNDVWPAQFVVDKIGPWQFTVEAWVDHFDTWVSDLAKRIDAQPDPHEPTQQIVGPQDIPLALRIGAGLVADAATRAKGADAKKLTAAAAKLEALAAAKHAHYASPISADLVALVAKYPDLRHATKYGAELPLWVDRERACFSSWYELFPRSTSPTPGKHGTLRDVEARLPEIAAMGFDILYMPPIHPIGMAYRKGKNNSVTATEGEEGSPWAIGSVEGGHTAIHPKLGTLADFDHLQSAARENGLELALDIAFQCSPDHPWVKEHPEWFTLRPDGTIQYAENPPKKYQDIYPLNFESSDWRGLWDALYGVFQFWVEHGVRAFRVDNPHTKALTFWEWCIGRILKDTPDVIFLAEAFTRPHVMYSLAKGGFTQSYTYFTWRTTKAELQQYFEELTQPPVSDFFRPNLWPNTPDILHEQLQTGGRPIFMQRLILAATLGANYGIYGPAYELLEGRPAKPAAGKTASEEYLDSEKYEIRNWDRSSPDSIVPLIAQLNQIRHANPALQRNENLHFHQVEEPNLLVYSKANADFSNVILVAVNLDPKVEHGGWVNLAMDKLGLPWLGTFEVEDLLTGAGYNWKDQWNFVSLNPSVMPAHIFRIVRDE
ncbi:MAG TPA: alpha-1,4-glucan--maltose-1-phosphate maltosyltransferase [Acidobacteriaceae bacterium]|nr:alpha-1,4-glucan--maltose-1-phosphate maltosyltransferase [Acidobacteriaceae bacterium]